MALSGSQFFGIGLQLLLDGDIDLEDNAGAGGMRCCLVDDTFQALADATIQAYDFMDDIRSMVPTGTADFELVTPTVLAPNTTATPDAVEWDDSGAAAATFATVEDLEVIEGVVIFQFNTADADSVPLCYIKFSSSVTANGGTITVTWAAPAGATAGGIFNIPVS